MKNNCRLCILAAAFLVAAFLLSGCHSAASASGTPPDFWHVPKTKVALYLDIGCKGGGVLHLAQLLKSSPEVDCDFINAADVLAGKLAGYDVLVMPGGLREQMWRAARPLVDKFKADGHRICTSCADADFIKTGEQT